MPCDGDGDESKGRLKAVNVAARVVAMGLAVASAALMVTASQCTIVLPNGAEAHTVTYSDFGPFVYLVVANAIAAVMVGVAIFLSVWKKGSGKCSKVLVPLLDVTAPALLYSATGAAFATTEYMSYCSPRGRGRVSVCDGTVRGTNNFCSQVHMAMYISLAAAGAVSAAELVKNLKLSFCSSGSDCESDAGCEHGCHHKH
ncbi:CASP-like protein 1U3 [Triticum dicoccoides]|uniref:CASP-like protein 1U3 n=1 Tax=Triticum dicoccoides TaxID=85692 RepID=UPI000E7B49F6|nr:CASP-like protein 1U3 [Triticum dicoccoides]